MNARWARSGVLFLLSVSVSACERQKPSPPTPVPLPEPPASAVASALPTATAAAAATGFVRQKPEERHGVDACAFLGGSGMACLEALTEEKDPILRRYMRRLSDADARQAFDDLKRGEPGGVAHAEMAMLCNASGPCGKKVSDIAGDGGYSCLTKAEAARQQKDLKTSKAAHKRACHCDPTGAQIPVMGGFLACDGKDKPVERGELLSTAEAADVRDCATCDADKGVAACAREITRLKSSDAEIAHYLETVHVPNCKKP
jgi:hypothetical protein